MQMFFFHLTTYLESCLTSVHKNLPPFSPLQRLHFIPLHRFTIVYLPGSIHGHLGYLFLLSQTILLWMYNFYTQKSVHFFITCTLFHRSLSLKEIPGSENAGENVTGIEHFDWHCYIFLCVSCAFILTTAAHGSTQSPHIAQPQKVLFKW